MNLLRDIIENYAKQSEVFRRALLLEKIRKNWQKQMKREITEYVWVGDVQNETLFLETNHTGWNQQILFLKNEIIEKFKAEGILKVVCKLTPSAQKEVEENKPILVRPYRIENASSIDQMAFLAKEYQTAWEMDGGLKCKSCGRQFNVTRDSDYCVLCEQKFNESRENKIKNLLKEVPWIKPQEAFDEIGISENEFAQAKEKRMAEIKDRYMQGVYEYEKTGSAITSRSVQRLFIDYTLLKTALTPDVINDKIIEQAVGPKIFKKIFKK